MHLQNEVEQLITDMNNDVDAAIVEGSRDEAGLREAGFEKPIYTCSTTNGLVGFANSIQEQRLTILTDFDTEGKELNARLRELLPGSRVQTIWRKKLGKLLTEHGHRDIESLNNLFNR